MKSLIPKTNYIWLDGKFVRYEDAKIHFLNHSLHYGSGAFEGERFYLTNRGPAIFRLHEHTERLFRSARVIGIKIPFSKNEVMNATRGLIRKNELDEGYIRPMVFYGAKMGLHPGQSPVHIGIAVWPWGAYLGDKPVSTSISKVMRLHPSSIVSTAKISGYYANSILATRDAKARGFDEAILLDYRGFIAEGPGENIFMVKNNKLYTPALGSILPGITRDSIIRIAKNSKIPVLEKTIKPIDLKNADELFFTGTAAEITPIGKVDSKIINEGLVGPYTARLKKIYLDIVHGKEKDYKNWLTFV